MKIRSNNKILKEQAGGIIYMPYLPSHQDYNSSKQEDLKTEGTKTSDVQKQILNILQEKGLPSDVRSFMQTANSFLLRAEQTGEWSVTDLTRIQSLAATVAHNKTLYDNATNHLTEKGNWNEVALDDKGDMYVVNKDGNIVTIDPKEYYKNKKNYQVLTNNDVLEYRANGKAFDSKILNSMSGSIGMDDVIDYTKDIVMNLGTKNLAGYVNSNSDWLNVSQTLNQIMSEGRNGYYKFKRSVQVDGSNEQTALNYLYNSLPINMKQLLRAKTAAEGQDPDRHFADILLQVLTNHTKSSLEVDFDSTTTNDGNTTPSSKGSVSDTYLRKVSTFANIKPDKVSIVPNYNSPIDQGIMTVTAYRLGPIVDRLTDNIDSDKFSLNYLISKAEFIKSGNTDMISIGGKTIKPSDFNKVMINNSNQVVGTVLPYKIDEKGNYVPDFSKIEAFNAWNKYIKDNPNVTEMEAQDLAQKVGLNGNDIEYDPNTNSYNLRNTMQFYGVSAYINSEVMDIDDDMKKYLYHMSRQEGKQIKDEYDNLLVYRTTTPNKNDKKIGSLGWFKTKDGNANTFYEGMIFIPITNPEIGSLLTVHGKMSNDMANNPVGFMTANEILQQANQNSNNENIGAFN